MTNVESRDPAWVAVQERLATALRESASDWGPRVCAHGSWDECDAGCEYDATRADTDKILSEFVIIGSFVSMEDGTASSVAVTPPGQLYHHTLGLVHEWLE